MFLCIYKETRLILTMLKVFRMGILFGKFGLLFRYPLSVFRVISHLKWASCPASVGCCVRDSVESQPTHIRVSHSSSLNRPHEGKHQTKWAGAYHQIISRNRLVNKLKHPSKIQKRRFPPGPVWVSDEQLLLWREPAPRQRSLKKKALLAHTLLRSRPPVLSHN